MRAGRRAEPGQKLAAGLTTRGTLLDTSPELFDQHVAVNLRGPFFLRAGHDRARQRALGLHDDLAGAAQVMAQVVLEHGAQAALLQEQFVLPVQILRA